MPWKPTTSNRHRERDVIQEQLNQATTVSEILGGVREKMRASLGVGEPCVELPLSEIKTFKDDEGHWRAVIGMDQLIYFVDNLLRRS